MTETGAAACGTRAAVTEPIGYCPGCGASLGAPRAFVQEFWHAADRMFLCWCPSCAMTTTVVLAERIVGYEPEH
ncbi:MAG: hypothetical protein ACRDRN_06890 [Sciscionella sp.]